jgi:hypothetical protein
MISRSINSEKVKLALLLKSRFEAGCILAGTEMGYYSADVLVLSKKREIIEFEVKTSFSDFKNDFTKLKHTHYRNVDRPHTMKEYERTDIPHFFVFVVPERLMNKVAAYLVKYPNYGLIVYKEDIDYYPSLHRIGGKSFMRTVKKPKKLHSNPITDEQLYKYQRRVKSDLCNTKKRLAKRS